MRCALPGSGASCFILLTRVKPRRSAGASLHDEPPPELQQLALNFLVTFFSRRVVVTDNRHTSALYPT